MRLMFTLFVLLFTQLFLNLANASPSHRVSAKQAETHVSQAKPDERRKRKVVARSNRKTKTVPVKEQSKAKEHSRTKEKVHGKAKVEHKHPTSTKLVRHKAEKPTASRLARHKAENSKKEINSISRSLAATTNVVCAKEGKKAYGRHRKHKTKEDTCTPLTLSAAHKKKYLHAKETAMNKLMHQVGKPYRWGGTSPNTGFDCSGLVYYAYKDLMRIKMPRTANEMYHLRDAAPVPRGELESGDLVFFRITKRGAADHVGVYLGNGKFIQSPRSGEDIKISYLADNYWQDHYVGARRVMTPKTIR
ncbi:C40 family peptidase [Rouxiella badensis]|jgi:murein DD-endopeptidase|uniref:Hydrolase n=1 Tax=Rouxiella badensis TaxID=1646377 RepID=A0A1X0WEQ1_9GAMM|nr:C40 family peptidase [Rouxiella badensis]MCC3701417.1 NlpC/P60 family protein [Rouxiella badensis]MCC3717844.1 NlpC/P60 family protein [Rouxiella badensis]MCC3730141.1 NlpC/P60 family protein [Rouxiella badensis]MCC3734151.1 NlpC/P60 family protein [Rouxiella badensis]MCC3739187.1 NlpC/P60 family protein [Rouxiella badensis]